MVADNLHALYALETKRMPAIEYSRISLNAWLKLFKTNLALSSHFKVIML